VLKLLVGSSSTSTRTHRHPRAPDRSTSLLGGDVGNFTHYRTASGTDARMVSLLSRPSCSARCPPLSPVKHVHLSGSMASR